MADDEISHAFHQRTEEFKEIKTLEIWCKENLEFSEPIKKEKQMRERMLGELCEPGCTWRCWEPHRMKPRGSHIPRENQKADSSDIFISVF